jgi:hypothetical protein
VNSGGRSRARVHSNVQLMDQEVPNHSDFDHGNIYGTAATLILMTALLQSTCNYGLAKYVKIPIPRLPEVVGAFSECPL